MSNSQNSMIGKKFKTIGTDFPFTVTDDKECGYTIESSNHPDAKAIEKKSLHDGLASGKTVEIIEEYEHEGRGVAIIKDRGSYSAVFSDIGIVIETIHGALNANSQDEIIKTLKRDVPSQIKTRSL